MRLYCESKKFLLRHLQVLFLRSAFDKVLHFTPICCHFSKICSCFTVCIYLMLISSLKLIPMFNSRCQILKRILNVPNIKLKQSKWYSNFYIYTILDTLLKCTQYYSKSVKMYKAACNGNSGVIRVAIKCCFHRIVKNTDASMGRSHVKYLTRETFMLLPFQFWVRLPFSSLQLFVHSVNDTLKIRGTIYRKIW